jgi:hypothetical protein
MAGCDIDLADLHSGRVMVEKKPQLTETFVFELFNFNC